MLHIVFVIIGILLALPALMYAIISGGTQRTPEEQRQEDFEQLRAINKQHR